MSFGVLLFAPIHPNLLDSLPSLYLCLKFKRISLIPFQTVDVVCLPKDAFRPRNGKTRKPIQVFMKHFCDTGEATSRKRGRVNNHLFNTFTPLVKGYKQDTKKVPPGLEKRMPSPSDLFVSLPLSLSLEVAASSRRRLETICC